ncbi:MAG: AI-2E family transporter [Candidatus Sulfotelmatobacter sp.]
MPRTKESSASSKSLVLIALVLAIAALYFGRQLFIPLALALVFTFLLTPFVSLLEKIRFRRAPAVLTVLVLAFGLGAAIAWGVANQLVAVMANLVDYKDNLDAKILSLHVSKGGTLSRATASVQELSSELAAVPAEIGRTQDQDKDKDSKTARSMRPVPVQVAAPPASFIQDLRELVGPLAEPAETAAIVIIFTLFMLIKREDLRNRAIRLAGRGQLNLMTQALDDAGRRLSRYLLLQCLVNAGYGLLFGVALYFIGVPHALLWAVFAGGLRFVPYVGSLIASALPIAVALAVFPGWYQAGLILAAFVFLELIVSYIVEPMLYGAHTGISSLAILVAAVFWTTLWGPVGLILSTPLTVCLIVLGRYVPQLNFLEVVLGDEPVLLPEQCFYQRLLASDREEARVIAEAHLRQNSLESLYETVILPALKLAEHDYHNDGLDDRTRTSLLQTMREMIEDFGDQDDGDQYNDGASIACIPARGGSDELITTMIAQLLRQARYQAHELSASAPDNLLTALSRLDCRIACISSISAFTVSEPRSLCKKLGGSLSSLPVVIGLWSLDASSARQRLGPGCSGVVATTLSDAIGQVRQLANPGSAPEILSESSKSQDLPA